MCYNKVIINGDYCDYWFYKYWKSKLHNVPVSFYFKLMKANRKLKLVLGIPGPGLPSLKFNVEAKIPNGKAPIPKDIWKPPSPKAKPGKPWDIL